MRGRPSDIRLLVLDVDGVLTDGRLYYSDSGWEAKAFNAHDGQGIKLLRGRGIKTAIISGRSSEAVRRRAEELGIDEVRLGVKDKLSTLGEILTKYGISPQQAAYIGDDVGDLEVMKSVGFPVAVANAHESVKRVAAYVTKRNGGDGAVREICDMLIYADEANEGNVNAVRIGDIRIGGGASLALIAGPCVIESRDHSLKMAEAIRSVAERIGIPFIFKSSYDKANRSSIRSYRGPGLDEGLRILDEVRRHVGVPVLSDVHCVRQIPAAAEVLDVIQIPAFLCRQTDLLIEAGKTGKPINVKKGQFLSPWEMRNVVEKILSTGNDRILLTERGTSFGYNNLVVDMRSLPIMRSLGYPVVFDATHSVQLPGGAGTRSGGQREFVPYLARAAVAAGVDALFMEVHDSPDEALCDGPNMIDLKTLERVLIQVIQIDRVVKYA